MNRDLTEADVQAWFVASLGVNSDYRVPEQKQLKSFVSYLNLARTLPKISEAFVDRATSKKESQDRVDLAQALQTLNRVLPGLISDWEKHASDPAEGQQYEKQMAKRVLEKRRLRALRLATDEAGKSFGRYPNIRIKIDRGAWHSTAQMIQWFVKSAFKSTGQPRINFTKPGGPAIKVVQSALRYVEGKERPATSIVEALR